MKRGYFRQYLILFLTIFCISDRLKAENNKYQNKLKCKLPQSLTKEIDSYKPILKDIQNATSNGFLHGQTYDELNTFVNKFNFRISGSKTLEHSIDYMLEKLKKNDFDNVHGEEVMVPHWVR
jgi:carboxypeptidase Q